MWRGVILGLLALAPIACDSSERLHTLADAREALEAHGLPTVVLLDRDESVPPSDIDPAALGLLNLFDELPPEVRGMAASAEAPEKSSTAARSVGGGWVLYVLASHVSADRFQAGARLPDGFSTAQVTRLQERNVIVMTFERGAEARARAALADLHNR